MLIKKITKLLVGTNNKGKLKEIKDLLPKNLKIYSPNDFKIKSPAENGKTFKENSLIKAKHFSKKSKMICLSDDSGLEIDILNRAPGIYSARWGGKKGDFEFDGDMQPDVALNGQYKELYPFSNIVGNANILVMPGQHSAAISYKLIRELGGAKVIGPLLVGLAQPIEIAPLRSSTSDILNLASVAAYSAGVINYN